MKRLIEIIGKAPSELSKEELLSHLKRERERVSRALEAYTQRTYKAKGKKPPKVPKRSLSVEELLGSLGITEEEFLAAKKEMEAEKDDKI